MQKVTEIYIYFFINGGSKRRNEVAEKSDISPGSIKKKKSDVFGDFPYLSLMMPLKIRIFQKHSNRLCYVNICF